MGASLQLVDDNSLRATQDGYAVGVRLNWYRSLPLSCIEKVELALDGRPVGPSALRLEVNGRRYQLEELEDQVETFWFVQDSARLLVEQPGVVKEGETHTVEVEIALRFPYIPIGPDKFLVNTTRCTVTQIAGGA